jgi:hypothetical protein
MAKPKRVKMSAYIMINVYYDKTKKGHYDKTKKGHYDKTKKGKNYTRHYDKTKKGKNYTRCK